MLAASAGELVTKDELMDRIWPGAIVLDNTLQVHAAAVRKALGPYRTLLKTEASRGYRLLGDWTVRQQSFRRHRRPDTNRGEASGTAPASNIPGPATRLVGHGVRRR